MKFAVMLALVLTAGFVVGPAAAQDAQVGRVEFVARVTPTAGRPEPAMRIGVHLLRKSYAEIHKEAEADIPAIDLDHFVDSLEVSKELKEWMKREKTAQLSGPDFIRKVKTKDIMDVQEFWEAYLSRNAGDVAVGFPKPKYVESDREKDPEKYKKQVQEFKDSVKKFITTYQHTKDGMDLYLTSMDPVQRWAQQSDDRQRDVRLRAQQLAGTDYLVAKTETDLQGRGGFVNVPPGEYWLSTLEQESVAGDVRLRWDTPVAVQAGQVARVELSNINAVRQGRRR